MSAKPDYVVTRFAESGFSTQAWMTDAGGHPIVVILEPPFVDRDRDGHRDRGLGRIQHGLYELFLRVSHRNGGDGRRDYDVWQYLNVPDVVAAQLHIGNFPWDSEACQLVGTAFDQVQYTGKTVADGFYPREHGRSYPGITGSSTAYEKWMKDSLGLCAREKRNHIWILVEDRFDAPAGSWS